MTVVNGQVATRRFHRDPFGHNRVQQVTPLAGSGRRIAPSGSEIVSGGVVVVVVRKLLAAQPALFHLHLRKTGLAIEQHAKASGCFTKPGAMRTHIEEEVSCVQDFLDSRAGHPEVAFVCVDEAPPVSQVEPGKKGVHRADTVRAIVTHDIAGRVVTGIGIPGLLDEIHLVAEPLEATEVLQTRTTSFRPSG